MLTYISIGVILIFILFILISWSLSNIILRPRVIDSEKLYLREIQEGRLVESTYQSWRKEDIILKSRYGYDLSCQILNSRYSEEQFKTGNKNRKVAIICHGYTCGKFSSMMYAELFLKRGITAFVYDHRNHGFSGKAFTSMGYYEKFDLQTVIDYCFERYGANLEIVLHGESMGAATVLSLLAMEDRIKCAIADCAFSNLKDLVIYLMKQYYHIPKYPFFPIAKVIIKVRAGFWIDDVVPMEGAIKSHTPILFIHGLEDNYIPCAMSKDMYDVNHKNRELYLAPKAKHAESCEKNHEEYEEVLMDFWDKYFS